MAGWVRILARLWRQTHYFCAGFNQGSTLRVKRKIWGSCRRFVHETARIRRLLSKKRDGWCRYYRIGKRKDMGTKGQVCLSFSWQTLIEILVSRSNEEIKEINELYKKMYGRQLEKELMSETSGHFRKLLVSLNNVRTFFRPCSLLVSTIAFT